MSGKQNDWIDSDQISQVASEHLSKDRIAFVFPICSPGGASFSQGQLDEGLSCSSSIKNDVGFL